MRVDDEVLLAILLEHGLLRLSGSWGVGCGENSGGDADLIDPPARGCEPRDEPSQARRSVCGGNGDRHPMTLRSKPMYSAASSGLANSIVRSSKCTIRP